MRIIIALSERGRVIGESHPNAKLSNNEVESMRDDHEYNGLSTAQVANKYGQPFGTTKKILFYQSRAATAARFITRER